MLTIDGVRYSSVSEASRMTGLSLSDLKRKYFTSGKGTVKGFSVVFDDAKEVDVRGWLAENYSTLLRTTKKYYEYDDDLFQQTLLYLIKRVDAGLVKNYEQAFYNRYRGAVMDVKKKEVKNRKRLAMQSYNHCSIDWEEEQGFSSTVPVIENETFYADSETGEEVSVLDLVEHSLWSESVPSPEVESVNELVKLDCVKMVLEETIEKKWIDFYFEWLAGAGKKKMGALARQYGMTDSDATKARKSVESKLNDEQVKQSIRDLYEVSRYRDLDNLTLKMIVE